MDPEEVWTMVLAVVNSTDITRYIDKDTFQVNSEDVYESWQNANFVEKRIFVRKRVSGKFEIRCGKGLTLANFISNWNQAVTNGVVTMGVFVQNDNSFQAIEAFYSFEGQEHVELDNGAFYDRLVVNIEEC